MTELSPAKSSLVLTQGEMLCPCCGKAKSIVAMDCQHCGAQQIAPRMAKPVIQLPKLHLALRAFGLVAFVGLGFTMFWVMNNDFKVGRALLVLAFGDGTELTKRLLNGDSHLATYRIFRWDGWRNAFYASFLALPLTALALHWARQAWRAARTLPGEFGGLRLAQGSLLMAVILLLFFSAAVVDGTPQLVERYQARRHAATRVAMYEQAQALRQHYHEFGVFPAESSELQAAGSVKLAVNDAWQTEFKYTPYSTVASSGKLVGFTNFTLVSAGPDAEFGTADDIFMVDGVIVDKPTSESDLPDSLLLTAPVKARK